MRNINPTVTSLSARQKYLRGNSTNRHHLSVVRKMGRRVRDKVKEGLESDIARRCPDLASSRKGPLGITRRCY